jgi:hypothetical protein
MNRRWKSCSDNDRSILRRQASGGGGDTTGATVVAMSDGYNLLDDFDE